MAPADRPVFASGSLVPAVAVALATFVLLAVTWAAFVFTTGDSFDALITAGDNFVAADRLPAVIEVRPGPGYDGQFFYRLALDPFPTTKVDDGVALDNPPYRAQRLMYPLLAWAAGGWYPPAAPFALLAVNLAAWSVTAGIGVHLARLWSRPWWHGLLVALYPGFVLSTARDLSEVVAAMFLAVGLAIVFAPPPRDTRPSRSLVHRDVAAGIALALAMLTRETTMVVAFGLLAAWCWDRWRRQPPMTGVWCWAIPLSCFVVWQSILFAVWNRVPVLAGEGSVGWPFTGVVRLVTADQLFTGSQLQQLFLAFVVIAVAATAAWRSLSGKAHRLTVWCLAVAATLWFSLTVLVWSELWAFMRAGTEIWCIASIGLIASRPTSPTTMPPVRPVLTREPLVTLIALATLGVGVAARCVVAAALDS